MSLTQAWNEAYPAGTTAANLIDDAMVQMKTQLREVISADHVMASNEGAGAATTGYHNKVTFVEQSASPTLVANTLMLFAKEVTSKTELFMDSYDSSTAEMQLTSNGDFIGGFRGEIVMWSGMLANIPAGWVLCDGTNSTPNLLTKFVRGIATAVTEPGTIAGSDTHTHTSSAHTHTVTAHTHDYSGTTAGAEDNWVGGRELNTSVSRVPHTHTYSGTTTGGTDAASSDASSSTMTTISNIPVYYALAFVIKL